MVSRCLALAVIFATSSMTVSSLAIADPRAVIELFTSQGCSSCPAADKLIGELASDPSLVPISVPIDYWDYLGWKDTLADPRNSARQKGYAHVRGDGQVYTPQAVVNGVLHALGSDRSAIEYAIKKSRQNSATMSLPVKFAIADGRVSVSAPDGAPPPRGSAEIWLCGLTKAVTVAIGRGENKGRTVTYHNVLRRWIKVGDWTGSANSWSVPLHVLKGDDVDVAAVLLQGGTVEKPRAIMGATLASIR
jgi:hypothetical protein